MMLIKGRSLGPSIRTACLINIVEATMRCRSGKYAYLPGALDRVITNAPPGFPPKEELVDYIEAALRAEEIPIGWIDWFEHAHEMV